MFRSQQRIRLITHKIFNLQQNDRKKKANALVEMFQKTIYVGGAGHESTVSYNDIVNCAKLCVNEMLKSQDYWNTPIEQKQYWNSVLTELNKM